MKQIAKVGDRVQLPGPLLQTGSPVRWTCERALTLGISTKRSDNIRNMADVYDEKAVGMVQITVPMATAASVVFPGHVKNVGRAIKNLGGEEALSSALGQSGRSLKCWPRSGVWLCSAVSLWLVYVLTPIHSADKRTGWLFAPSVQRISANQPVAAESDAD